MKRISPFILFISFALATTACIPDIVGRNPSENSGPAPTPQPVGKILSSFNPIQGTNYLMAGVVSAPASRDSSFNPLEWINNSGYSSYSSGTYNYVFFNLETETYKRLLPTNEYVIYQTSGFPAFQYDPANPEKTAPPVEWWLFSIVKKDTNKDGYLDFKDKLTISLSDVSGGGYTELVENVDAVLGQVYKDSSAMFIMYNAGQKNYIAKINLSTREVLTTTEMDLGEDVK